VKFQDARYIARAQQLAPWLWRHAYPMHSKRGRFCMRLWCGLLKAHRFAWVRGVEL
jgi:hypothetical protein